jgi:hypothetical protein
MREASDAALRRSAKLGRVLRRESVVEEVGWVRKKTEGFAVKISSGRRVWRKEGREIGRLLRASCFVD